MTPADRYHSHLAPPKDCSNGLFSPTSNYPNPSTTNNNFQIITCTSSTNSSSNNNSTTHISANGNLVNSSSTCHIAGQTPVFFAPSSFIVASHKASQQDFHDALIHNKQLGTPRGPLHLVDMKEVIGGGEGVSCGAAEQLRVGTRPHKRFASGAQEYDPGPGSARSGTGEEMSMEYVDHMEAADIYMDHLEGGGAAELMKKGSRRLGYDQVKALEKAFEVENRLEPERKVRLASQLGLQPRQVAVWFQNRRARWKTKQMEKEFTVLKNKFEALKADRNKLLQEKDHLQAELARLKGQALMEGILVSKREHQQDSPTLASGSLVDDAAPASQAPAMSKQGGARSHRRGDEQLEEEEEEQEEEEIEEEDGASPKPGSNIIVQLHEQKLFQNDSLSSTEDSDINNDGAIVDSTSKAFQEETDFYAHHWRLPAAPTQLLYKPTATTIKSEEWQEQGENMGPFNMSLDTNWYNW